eukprot:CAMPEP_0197177200 /NCGR_PEP_ID=MMETSP1423-20130617/2901_1 /TAXON_ID=476441 /ORGANISM="Pseudo-nitzschia heimii, Strain UNC1101" /LENGTH=321 /DNA_ID=CAMNT_0042626721 /DNA_START=58 /DNA_END=1023 /DNA_ORIENTATION=-
MTIIAGAAAVADSRSTTPEAALAKLSIRDDDNNDKEEEEPRVSNNDGADEEDVVVADAAADSAVVVSYTEEELESIRAVKKALISEKHGIDPDRIGSKTLAMTMIVSKLRVDEAADKYAKYLKAVEECGVESLRDDLISSSTIGDDERLRSHIASSYAACGRNHRGGSVMWITGSETLPVEEEPRVVLAGILYHLAIHADPVSLREGIAFVVDTSRKPAVRAANDKKLQRTWQSMPMRPQALLIAGASLPLRLVINTLIKVASLFTKQKIVDRIKFVSVEKAVDSVPRESAPTYLGGGGGGIDDIVRWTKDRIDAFPAPDL